MDRKPLSREPLNISSLLIQSRRSNDDSSTIYHIGDGIIGIQWDGEGYVYEIGDIVVSDGRLSHFPPKGIHGVIFYIAEPFADGRSNDVLLVRWFNGEDPTWVKVKDLESDIF